jgi:cytochrome c biogenesis protein CcmG/thiol:disulfide interchange protein DsbE
MNWKRAGIGVASMIPIVALLSYGMTRDPASIPSPLPGKPAPPFALVTMDGGDTVRTADLRGKVVVLNFWASWCLPCRDEHEALTTAARIYGPRGVQFYGVLYNDTPENARKWIEDVGGVNYPTLLDSRTHTAIDYGLYGVPETFFITPDGRVARKYIGPVTTKIMAEILEPLLNSRTASLP